VLALACALVLGGVLADLPQATLGCMVVVAVLGLIDPAAFVRYWRLSRLEFWIAVVTAGGGLLLGLLPAVLIGVLLTLGLVLVELDRMGITELQPTVGGADVHPAGRETAPVPGLVVLRPNGPLYTANVRSVSRKVQDTVADRPGTKVVTLDATTIGGLTLTVVEELKELGHELADVGIELWLAGFPPRALATARQLPRWQELEERGRIHPTALAAVAAFRAR
jgi:MFS superfamily sulfate permease-like transporter